MNLQSSDFELFDIPARFVQDRTALDARWRELQRQVHPDRFAQEGAAAQRVAMQWSARINEAYQRLKDPLKRAAYLCELHGTFVQSESNTAMPAEFLMQQMQWHEALEDARDCKEIQSLHAQVRQQQQCMERQCAHLLDEQGDYISAVALVRAWMFTERFAQKLKDRLAQMSPS